MVLKEFGLLDIWKVHVGEFQALLDRLSVDEQKFIQDGYEEVEKASKEKAPEVEESTNHGLSSWTPDDT